MCLQSLQVEELWLNMEVLMKRTERVSCKFYMSNICFGVLFACTDKFA